MLLELFLATAFQAAPGDAIALSRRSVRGSEPHSVIVGAGQLFELAERARSRGDVAVAAAAYRALAEDPNRDVRAEALFRHARMIAARGDHRGAALLLRRLLDQLPKATAVRLELAGLLDRMGDREAALRELRALRSSDLPVNVARFVDRLSASLLASKPVSFQVELALAPDSNINRATNSDTLGTIFGDFEVEKAAKATSGLGAAARAVALGRLQLSENLDLIARAGGEANLYRRKSFNDIALDLAIGPEIRVRRMRLATELGAGQQWYGMRPYQRSMRLAASVVAPLDAVSQARLDVVGRLVDNRLNNLQDGKGSAARLRYERALSPRLLVSAHAGADRFWAAEAAYSTRCWSGGLAAYREMGRMTLSAGFEVGGLTADERLALLVKTRKDRLSRFTVGAVFRQLSFAGFAPVTRLVIERNRSTVEFHDYSRTRTEVGISRAF